MSNYERALPAYEIPPALPGDIYSQKRSSEKRKEENNGERIKNDLNGIGA